MQAADRPIAVAIVGGGESLNYAELERRSNRLARYLQELGVGSDAVVGLHLDRSPEMVISALAVMKAGAAYLPLPPDAPEQRREFMLRDAGAKIVITRKGLRDSLPMLGDMRAIDADGAEVAARNSAKLGVLIKPSDVAYVIYTSGSTGQPKGVEVLHRGLSNLVNWHVSAFKVCSEDRASHCAHLGFDAAVWELWPYLTVGATVHLAPEEVRREAETLRDWLVKERITMSFAATPIAERLIAISWPKETCLRVLLTGADTLHQRPKPGLPFSVVNNYGPTECTVVATSGEVQTAASSSSRPSIGRAIDNVELFIVDEQMRQVVPGTAGELYIGGAGVGRGYRNQPALTAEKFITNPFADSPDILYRTGDLVRALENGELEFLGRCDEQLKIRGYRIEPEEIVSVLNQYPGVEASAVVAREQNEEKILVAYLVIAENCVIAATKLQEHIEKRFPSYMVPSQFVRLKTLPVTANGKIDRTGLPEPSASNSLMDEGFIAPRTMVEQRLAGILSQLLKVQNVGTNDNFFLLGGHSLLGTQLITRIRQSFGVELSLLSLFDHPTVAGMSEEIEKLILAKLETTGSVTISTANVSGVQTSVQ